MAATSGSMPGAGSVEAAESAAARRFGRSRGDTGTMPPARPGPGHRSVRWSAGDRRSVRRCAWRSSPRSRGRRGSATRGRGRRRISACVLIGRSGNRSRSTRSATRSSGRGEPSGRRPHRGRHTGDRAGARAGSGAGDRRSARCDRYDDTPVTRSCRMSAIRERGARQGSPFCVRDGPRRLTARVAQAHPHGDAPARRRCRSRASRPPGAGRARGRSSAPRPPGRCERSRRRQRIGRFRWTSVCVWNWCATDRMRSSA